MTSDQDAGEKREAVQEDVEAFELASQRRRRFLVFCCMLVAAVLGANLLYGTVVITREFRSYCLVCHRTSGPAAMWEASERHAEGLTCGQCHGMLPGQKGRCGCCRPEGMGSAMDEHPVLRLDLPCSLGFHSSCLSPF